jgi:hypothetical protein
VKNYQSTVSVAIYFTKKNSANYVDDQGCEKLGEFPVDIRRNVFRFVVGNFSKTFRISRIMLTFVVSNSDSINSLFIRILSPTIDILLWYSEVYLW